ncbi:MAG TPA: hypothetical protein VGR51_04880 [Thermoplasmata archaeon]|nr:hypothetical protein [Thermoplasmata archaeon]
MTVGVLDLYRLKLHMYLGPVRRQPALLAVFVLLAFLVLPGAFGIGYFFGEAIGPLGDLVENAALGLSMFAAIALLAAPGGGLMLQGAEVDFVAVAPVSVRRFVLADALFQTTAFGIGLPAIALGSLGFTLRTGAPVWTFLVPPFVFVTVLFLGVLVVQTIGIARLAGNRWALPLALLLFGLLVAPAFARFALHIPVAYARLPYPTTAAIQVALLPYGLGSWAGVPVLLAFGALVVAAHAWVTDRPSIPNLRATFAAFGISPESRRIQQAAMMRVFGRIRRAGGTRVYRPRLLATMAALHRVRMTRDGTLFLALILSVALGLPSFLAGPEFSFGGFYVVVFLPIAAVGQWMATDRSNLWIVKVSSGSPQSFFSGWWLALGSLVAIAGAAVSLIGGLGTGRIDAGGIGISVAGALGACAGAVIAAARFPYAPNEFTVRPFLHFLLTGLFAGLAVAPAAAAGFLLSGLALAVVLAAILIGVGWGLFLLVGRATKNPML